MALRLLGVGSPLIDRSARVTDEFVSVRAGGGKGGTRHLNAAERSALLAELPEPVLTVPGGAAANTVMAAAELGLETALLGKLGADADGARFRAGLSASGAADRELITAPRGDTGCCIALITPDAERTMRSHLGVSYELTAAEAARCDFSRYDWVLMEGYFAESEMFEPTMRLARAAGCHVAMDVCSYEQAARRRELFHRLLRTYADLIFANADEAAALTGLTAPEAMARQLAGGRRTAVVKLGAAGSLIAVADRLYRIPAAPVEQAVDTTAAGDYYAAGFFYGLSRKLPWEKCGYAGSLTAAAVVRCAGTKLSPAALTALKAQLAEL